MPEDDAVRAGGPGATAAALDGPEVLLAGDPEAIAMAAAALGSGGIVGLPTETVYGVAVLPRPESLRALLLAKQRPADKGIPLLIDQLDQVAGLVVVPHGPASRCVLLAWAADAGPAAAPTGRRAGGAQRRSHVPGRAHPRSCRAS